MIEIAVYDIGRACHRVELPRTNYIVDASLSLGPTACSPINLLTQRYRFDNCLLQGLLAARRAKLERGALKRTGGAFFS